MRESPSNSPREHYSIRFSTDREQDGQIVVFRKTEGVEIRKKKKKIILIRAKIERLERRVGIGNRRWVGDGTCHVNDTLQMKSGILLVGRWKRVMIYELI